eukprot:TRINITY_DN243_c0_g1_i3.p1 TRINITY_DN243_c0_g1~~TRINITY_DN243_c0_g1_i3.p1  ORF type:complete len:456 (+),score=172.43 TRINITY_DN243_c0_g1_i3:93-1460(+)
MTAGKSLPMQHLGEIQKQTTIVPRKGLPMQHWGEMRCHIRMLNWLLGSEARRKADFAEPRKRLDEMYAGLSEVKDAEAALPKKERLLEMMNYFEEALNKYMFQSFIGAKGAAIFVDRSLEKIQWAYEFFRKYPRALEKKIEKPIIILGLHRTGSTTLQRLLSLDPSANEMNLWKICADPLNDTYQSACTKVRRDFTFDAVSPSFQQGLVDYHPMEPDLPDEDSMLVFPFFRVAADYAVNYPSESVHVQKLMNDPQQQRDGFRFVRQWMKMWSVKENPLVKPEETEETRHWVIKNPFHGHAINELLEEFPDARLVFTHRKFADCMKSMAGLKLVNTAVLTEPTMFDSHLIGMNATIFEQILARRTVEFVKEHPSRDDVHVTHKKIMADPIGTVRDIYEQFGMPFTEEYHQILKEFVAGSPPVPSAVKKSLSHFGLTVDDVMNADAAAYDAMFVDGK